jgi:flavin reductase
MGSPNRNGSHAGGAAVGVESAGGEQQRALFRRWPAGVSVVVAEVEGRRAGLTVSSLTSLSLEPRLVGISIALQASLHDLLLEAEEWAVSMLAGDQDRLARHFASGLPPLILWEGIAVREDLRLLDGAAGWLTARTVDRVTTGDHTLFVGEVQTIEHGSAATSLTYVDREYRAL